MILAICDNPETLTAVKYAQIAINLIKIVVPIALIIAIMVSLINVVSGNNPDELSQVLKSSVNKILAAVLVFLVPTFVSIIFSTLNAKSINFAACLDNANDETIAAAYIKRANKYVEVANDTLLRGDYNIALSSVNKLEDEAEKEKLNKQLEAVLKKIEEREEEERKKQEIHFIAGDGEYTYPLGDYKATLTACFAGNDNVHRLLGGGHGAIDLSAPFNTPVYASKGGKVIIASDKVSFNSHNLLYCYLGCGNQVKIDHLDGTMTMYCHLYPKSLTVKPGDIVSQGQQIAKVGSTGCSTGAHLHFAIYVDNKLVDPINYTKLNVTNPEHCG